MELRHLRYFVAVAETMNFHRAAENLHISQPPLSTQIKDLEHELGVDLFVRDKRRIHLTAAGNVFLNHARYILSNASEAKRQAIMAASGMEGTLSVRFVSSAVTGTLQTLVNRFKSKYPQVDVSLSQSISTQIIQALGENEIDIGLVRTPKTLPENLHGVLVLKESYNVALSSNHPLCRKKRIHPQDLRDERLLIFPRNTGADSFDDVMRIFHKYDISPENVHEIQEGMTIAGQLTVAGLVASGMGYSIVPECFTKLPVPGVTHRPLVGGKNRTGIMAVAHKQSEPTAKNFMGLLKSA
ncbi:MAG: LysR family transcriptional regulator [Gammaproteobacteria bacterium]|nr:LysR family transcriptional regulator [Gammaproteobacteria bacterium]